MTSLPIHHAKERSGLRICSKSAKSGNIEGETAGRAELRNYPPLKSPDQYSAFEEPGSDDQFLMNGGANKTITLGRTISPSSCDEPDKYGEGEAMNDRDFGSAPDGAENAGSSGRLQGRSVEVDFARYEQLLADESLDEGQRRAFFEALWSIIIAFVDLGFGVHPAQVVEGNTEYDGTCAPDLLENSGHETLKSVANEFEGAADPDTAASAAKEDT